MIHVIYTMVCILAMQLPNTSTDKTQDRSTLQRFFCQDEGCTVASRGLACIDRNGHQGGMRQKQFLDQLRISLDYYDSLALSSVTRML
jgi:hypothetical protein